MNLMNFFKFPPPKSNHSAGKKMPLKNLVTRYSATTTLFNSVILQTQDFFAVMIKVAHP